MRKAKIQLIHANCSATRMIGFISVSPGQANAWDSAYRSFCRATSFPAAS
jgi:hypothetical protein